MQSYQDIPDTKTLTESRALILNNIATAMSQNSGTTFPTANLWVGMSCYRTDEQKLYILHAIGPDTWKLWMDFSGAVGKAPDADKVDGVDIMASADYATAMAIALG